MSLRIVCRWSFAIEWLYGVMETFQSGGKWSLKWCGGIWVFFDSKCIIFYDFIFLFCHWGGLGTRTPGPPMKKHQDFFQDQFSRFWILDLDLDFQKHLKKILILKCFKIGRLGNDCSIDQLFDRSTVHWLIVRSKDRLIIRSIDCSIDWEFWSITNYSEITFWES